MGTRAAAFAPVADLGLAVKRPVLLDRFASILPLTAATPRITLGEGATPLIAAPRLGASIGADAAHLVNMAAMGSAMARIVFDIERPTLGLLNIGVEEVKGLEEVREAALLLHVVDLSSPHAAQHIAHVNKVLAELGAADAPRVLVLNKSDLAAAAGDDLETLRQRLLDQLADIAGQVPALSPERLAQEVVLLVAKADVREELDRLAAHVAQGREMIGAKEPVGRRLDFLSQELNREANTLCSKSSDLALTRIGLDLKASIEQFREQVQNIE